MARVALVSHDVQAVQGRAGGVGTFVTNWARLLKSGGDDVTIIVVHQEVQSPGLDSRWVENYRSWGKDFDVCTMPFQDLPITRSMHAVKIYEYLAAGKHVLVPALPEMLPFADQGLLFTYRTLQESFELLEALVARPPLPDEISSRSSFAARNDWSERLDRFFDAMQRRGFTERAHSAPGSGA